MRVGVIIPQAMAMPTKSKSLTITDERVYGPYHPGEILREEFLTEIGMSPEALATHLALPIADVDALLGERAPVTGEIALRLGRLFGTTPEFWLGIQQQFELESAIDAAGDRIEREVQPLKSAG